MVPHLQYCRKMYVKQTKVAYLFCKVYLFLFSFCYNWIFSQGIFLDTYGQVLFFLFIYSFGFRIKIMTEFPEIYKFMTVFHKLFPRRLLSLGGYLWNFLKTKKRKIVFHILFFFPKIDLVNKPFLFCCFTTYKINDKWILFFYECFSCLKTKLLLLLLYKILSSSPWTLS